MGDDMMREDELHRELEVLRARVTELEAAEAERERAEEALLLAQFTVDHAAMATFWIAKDAQVFRVNDAACRALGYSREELLTMTVHDFDPHFPREKWQDHWKDLRHRGSMSFESHHRAKDGRVFPVEIFAKYLEFRAQEYNVAFARDITDRRQAEKALRESEARYRSLFDRVPVGLYRSTPAGRIEAANPALVKMLGYPNADSLLETDVRSLYTELSDRQRLLQEIDRSGVAHDLEFQLCRHDGARVWVTENRRCYPG